MHRKLLAIPAAAILILSGTAGMGRVGGTAHAQGTRDSSSGTIAITDYQFPDSLILGGAYSNGVADAEIGGALFDSPIGLDQSGNFFADLATVVPTTKNGGIKVVNGHEILTVHLKPNLKWSDGSANTGSDYILSLLMDFAPEYNQTNGIDAIQTVTFSGNDMIITYKSLYAPALSYGIPALLPTTYLEKKYGITVDPSLLQSYDASKVAAMFAASSYKGSNLQKFVVKWAADTYNSPSDVTNGPYKLAEWTPDQRITLVPNTDYTALPPDPKHPIPAKIQFVVVSENPNTLVQDLGSSATYNSIDKAEDFGLTDVPTLSRSKYQIVVPQALTYEHLELNQANPALANVQVRQALYYGISKLAYLRALYPGLRSSDYTTVALQSPLPSVSPWSNNASLPVDPYNPAKARTLLKAAGYGPGGKPLTLNFVTTNSSFRIRSGQLLQRLWAQIGVSIKIRYATAFGSNGLFSTYNDGGVLFRRRFDIAEFAFGTSPDPDQTIANVDPKFIPNATHPTGENYTGMNDPQITKDMQQARVTLDDATRHKFYNDFQTRLVQQAYWIMLYNRPNIIAFKGTIGNFKPNVTQAGNEWNTWQWWVDPTGSQKPLAS